MAPTARHALRRLEAAAVGEEFHDVCVRRGIELLVLFGSAVRPEEDEPRDVDLAVRFQHGVQGEMLALLQDLYDLTGYEHFDVLDLGRALPLARERALVGALPLFESRPGVFANRQIEAIRDRMDTDEMRRVELELMRR